MFRKFIAVMALTLFVSTSYAGQTSIDTSGLPDAAIAELKAQAAKAVAAHAKEASGLPVSVENTGALMSLASTWGTQAAQAAEGFARAISIAARELGVTVNEFLKTDAGRLTAALIIWKVAGASIVSILYGMMFITVGLAIARIIYKRLFTKEYQQVEYSWFGGFFKGTKLVRIPKNVSELRTDGEWLAFWMMIILCMGTMAIGGAIII